MQYTALHRVGKDRAVERSWFFQDFMKSGTGRQMDEDKTLVEKARSGDKAAFGKLVQRHQRRVYATALQMTGDHEEADDIAQDAFLRAFAAIDRFDGRSEFDTWLYRIVVNLAINHLKKRGRTRPSPDADPRVLGSVGDESSDPGRALEKRRFYERLFAALDELPETLAATVVLVSFQGLTHRQAAEVLGCSEGTVSWRIHEARKRLREELAEDLAALRADGRGGS